MTNRDGSSGLRAARVARGWSQTDAARELGSLARARGTPAAAAASLKTLLSRWENGHSVPDQQYRALLTDLYGRSAAELGISGPQLAGSEPAAGLRAAFAAAAAAHRTGIQVWRRQLELIRELDDELGAAGAGELTQALATRLTETLLHTVPRSARTQLAELLTEATGLAGVQALDRAHHDRAWRWFDRARSAASTAERPAAGAAAIAGQAAVLMEIGEPAVAIELLAQTPTTSDDVTQVRLDAALAMARAAAGEREASRDAIAAAERRLRRLPEEAVDPAHRPSVELADLHRWQGRVLVTLGDSHAVEPLRRALHAGPRSVRHRAAVHADLALSLHAELPREAAAHAHTARQLAAGIGSERITARLAELGSPR